MKFDAKKLERLTRPNFFSGKPISADDLRAEQEYQRQKQWLHNRMLHGYGIASGLEVIVEENDEGGTQVTVAPGYGLDGWGRELVVTDEMKRTLPKERRDLVLYLRYVREDDDDDSTKAMGAMQVQAKGESAELMFEPPPAERALAPTARQDFAIPLARLRRPHLNWQRDRTFRPPRTR